MVEYKQKLNQHNMLKLILLCTFCLLQVPIVIIRVLVRLRRINHDNNNEKDYLISSDALLLTDFILRTLYFAFELTIFVIFLQLVAYFANRKRKQIAKEFGYTSIETAIGATFASNSQVNRPPIRITLYHKIMIIAVMIIALMNLEYSLFSFYYTTAKFIAKDLDINDENTSDDSLQSKWIRDLQRYIIWPIFDLFTATALVYLAYLMGIKQLSRKKLKKQNNSNNLPNNQVPNKKKGMNSAIDDDMREQQSFRHNYDTQSVNLLFQGVGHNQGSGSAYGRQVSINHIEDENKKTQQTVAKKSTMGGESNKKSNKSNNLVSQYMHSDSGQSSGEFGGSQERTPIAKKKQTNTKKGTDHANPTEERKFTYDDEATEQAGLELGYNMESDLEDEGENLWENQAKNYKRVLAEDSSMGDKNILKRYMEELFR
ncbi:hypothetical protein FGO68_gene3028 [Halteria grandinella]|uniref:Uncharacterized protein n=1 Tax=Halteria grandinella TaxID=5974 RepID=A0A8J8NTV1_HALGN|nr:hypothetical protein FGO68_gene3028 [Halteria grandinella]